MSYFIQFQSLQGQGKDKQNGPQDPVYEAQDGSRDQGREDPVEVNPWQDIGCDAYRQGVNEPVG